LDAAALEAGYWRSCRRFYQWSNIIRGAATKPATAALRHLAYAGGMKKFGWLWHQIIRVKRVSTGLPLLEHALALGGGRSPRAQAAPGRTAIEES
jgi:hypothetical protein